MTDVKKNMDMDENALEDVTGGVGVPGGPQISYTLTRYRCPNCGREVALMRPVAPACPRCGMQMIK